MGDKILILGIKPYNFVNKETGEVISGTKVSYISNHKSEHGHLPIQISIKDDNTVKNITKVPGVYNCNYAMLPGKNNKPTPTIIGFEFISSYEFKF